MEFRLSSETNCLISNLRMNQGNNVSWDFDSGDSFLIVYYNGFSEFKTYDLLNYDLLDQIFERGLVRKYINNSEVFFQIVSRDTAIQYRQSGIRIPDQIEAIIRRPMVIKVYAIVDGTAHIPDTEGKDNKVTIPVIIKWHIEEPSVRNLFKRILSIKTSFNICPGAVGYTVSGRRFFYPFPDNCYNRNIILQFKEPISIKVKNEFRDFIKLVNT